jgi:nitroreductase
VTEYIYNLTKRRKTIRKFSSRPVDWKDVAIAIKSACQAPSGANAQPWRFLIVTDPQTKKRIRKACEQGEKEFYSKVNGELKKWLLRRGLKKKAPYSTQSVWLAIGYILLVIEEQGLGTITYTPSITKSVLDVLDVPKDYRLEVILPIGFSADEKTKEQRLKPDEVTYINSWGHSSEKSI